MDTGTHAVMGIALGGLATLNPVIANDPTLTQAVLIGTIVGSQAPDIDTVLKLKSNALYIRNHRGVTHSIPAIILWPFLIVATILFFIPEVSFLHLWFWTFLAVFLHVFVDIFNAYGTQALSPISKKWIALGIINTFDPFIFCAHIVAILFWSFGTNPGYTFLSLYVLVVGYYLWRCYAHRRVYHHAKQLFPDSTHVFISPTFSWKQWHVVIRTPTMLYVAESRNDNINFFESYPFVPIPATAIIEAAQKDKNLSAFLSFSPAYRWEVAESDKKIFVRFIDLRYRYKGYYPFKAIVQLDQNLTIISSYTGWIFSEQKLQKKLDLTTQS